MATPRSIDPSFWRGKRVLVTGHTGFKGAWLCLLLSHMGARVHGFSLPAEAPSLYAQARVAELLAAETLGDIEDAALTGQVVDAAAPEIVIHFAAQSLVRRAHYEPVRTFATNVMGTVNVLEALRGRGDLQAIFVTTTDKVYLNLETGARFTEADPLGGHEPYGASKAAAEMVISAYNASYFAPARIPLLTVRAGNVIGGGDWSKDRILPDMIRAMMANEAVRVRNPQATRPWQLVLDALEGYLLLIEAFAGGSARELNPAVMAWNFGPADDADMVRVEQLCGWVADAWPDRFSWVAAPDPAAPPESGLLHLHSGRAMSELGWSPRLSAREAVLETIDWYGRVLAGEDARSVSISHIERRFPQTA